jgi:hypothetical protein
MAELSLKRLPQNHLVLGLIAVLLCSDISLAQSASARPSQQPETRHQRWLPLPGGRIPDGMRLEDLLRKTSPLKNVSEEDRPGSAIDSNRPDNSNRSTEEQVRQLQKVIKELGDQLPPGMKPPNFDGLSSEALAKALEDPEVREKANELVEKFRQSQSSQKSLENGPVQAREDTQDQANEKSSQDPSEKKTPWRNRYDKSDPRAQDGNAGNGNTRNGNARNSGTPKGENGNQPASKEQGVPASSPIDPKLFGNPTRDREMESPTPSLDAENSKPTERAKPSQSQKSDQEQIAQSFDEFLKQAEAAEEKRSAAAENTKKQLNEKGFGAALDKILQEAREATEANERELQKQSASDSTNTRLTDKSSNEKNRNAKRTGDKSASKPSGATTNPATQPGVNKPGVNKPGVNKPGTNKPTPAPDSSSYEPSPPSQPTEQDESGWSKWFQSIATQIFETAPVSASSSDSTDSGADTLPTFSWSFQSLWLVSAIAALAGGILAAMAFFKGNRLAKPSSLEAQLGKADLLKQPDLIQSRSDVIRAFHQLAYRIAHPLETWSTHRGIARQVTNATPQIQTPLTLLADVYEQARYLPLDVRLTSEQLESVRKAIVECE